MGFILGISGVIKWQGEIYAFYVGIVGLCLMNYFSEREEVPILLSVSDF